MKYKFPSVYLFFGIFILLLPLSVTGHDYNTDWSYENEYFSITVLYSNPYMQEALLGFRLKDGISRYNFSYKLSEFSKDIPRLLVKEEGGYKPFKGLDIALDTQKREEIISLKFAEGLQYRSGIYSLTLRPVEDSGTLPAINLNLYHSRYAEILLEKRNVHFNVSSGPGRYGLAEPLHLAVKTNYTGWNLKVFSSLIFPGENIDVYIACNGASAVPIEKGGTVIEKDSESMNKIYLLELFIETDNMIKAGEYSGGTIVFSLE
ncbi:MAG: hypothetical protein GX175_02105 [Halanaerobiaceae bacterium]|nr:hypothetical protein [Halanaerobiaceae bacterium]